MPRAAAEGEREIESLEAFDAVTATHTSLDGWTVQSVDLSGRVAALETLGVSGAVFLGCTMSYSLAEDLTERGALVFPKLPQLAFNPYRASLYTAAELYDAQLDGGHYAQSSDARVFEWFASLGSVPPIQASLAMSLHDHAISDALDETWGVAEAKRSVGVMGGHATGRDEQTYIDAVHLGCSLASAGFVVATGGGPGSMEAANLGALLAGRKDRLDGVLAQLSHVPSFKPDISAWAQVAFDVLATLDACDTAKQDANSIGVPTWFYGHEPPNVFARRIAKFFSNAIREDTLLQRCRAGIIYLPGAAGTVQEIFQTATRNYYASADEDVTPLILVGHDHWTKKLPAWPLLNSLGADRAMGANLHLVDSIPEALNVLVG